MRVAKAKLSRAASLTFAGFAIAGIATFLAIMVQSARQTPGWEGLLSGTVLGVVTGLMIVGAGAGVAMKLLTVETAPPQLDDAAATALAPVLAALEATRLDIIRQARGRAMWRVPLGMAAGVVIWAIGEERDSLFQLAMTVGGGGLIGEFWASYALGQRYRRLYKDRVLPQLAARFGALYYRAAKHPDIGRLREDNIFRDFDRVLAEDELVGIYQGLAVSIIELKLEVGSGKTRRASFDGLLVEVELPRRLRGDTAVLPDGGKFGNFRDWIADGRREQVRLEDPRFEADYEVWATDQVTARALLTPAFVERFLALGQLPGFGTPLAVAHDEKLLLVIPNEGKNLFEPPSYRRPAAGRAALGELDRDIGTVLALTDAVIELDYAARAVATDHIRSRIGP